MKTLVVGDMHLLPKTLRYYAILEAEHRIHASFLIDDSSGVTRKTVVNEMFNVHYARDSSNRLIAWIYHLVAYRRLLRELNPDLLEVYTSRHPLLLLIMVWLAKIRRIPVLVTCRGELYYFNARPNTPRMSRLERWSLARVLRSASAIIYRETYMPALLDKICPATPRYFGHNSVPVGPQPKLERSEDVVLFLNGFSRWRNVDLLVRAAKLVRKAVPAAKFLLVGKQREWVPDRIKKHEKYRAAAEYDREIDELIEELDLKDTVAAVPFSFSVHDFYNQAKVYVLPANLVFCNHALLEAMERGVPPIVSDEEDEDARRIVEDGVSGLVVPLNERAFADAIVKLLTQEDVRLHLAQGARQKVVEQYNSSKCLASLANQYWGLVRHKPTAYGRATLGAKPFRRALK